MDKAKAAVSDFMHKAGHHDTTVHETVAPAVVNETLSKHRHEEATTAIDREIHQDHYHTSIQPVKDREVLPEEHHHKLVGVEHREHHHGDENAIKARLEQERAQFQDTRTEGKTRESHSVAPVIAGEHVHHHVHETIQPIVQKETIQPSVVHTTIPIHEVHHNEAKHHAASALPAVSMADFKKQGGSLTGREERYDGFEGEPRAVGSALGGSSTTGSGLTGHHSGSTTTGPHNSKLENKLDPRVDSDRDGSRNLGATRSGPGATSSTGTGYGSNTTSGPHSSNVENKLDPRVDSDRDGSRRVGSTGTTGTGYGSNTTSGPHTSNIENKLDPRVDSDRDGSRNLGATGTGTGTTGSGYGNTSGGGVGRHTGVGSNTTDTGFGNTTDTGYGTDGSTRGTGATHHAKPGLLDRLNPMKDTSDRY